MYIIAEIGCNHKGELETAIEMVKVAASYCKVNAVKFQKRNPRECLSKEQYNSPHPEPHNSYGNTYGEHREALELSLTDHHILQGVCKRENIDYGCSVWDSTSLDEIMDIRPDFIKIPSARNNHWDLMEHACSGWEGQLHISLGMTTRGEEDKISTLVNRRRAKRRSTILYSCTSGYPVPFEDICLGEIERLQRRFAGFPIGFSGHHLGIAVDIAAMVLGATRIERHFTLNRTWKGTDHAASLEPEGMRKLARDLWNVSKSLGTKPYSGILPIEEEQRRKLKC